jgi:Icc-related predicted phosphoesterase
MFLRILVIADIHGDFKSLEKLLEIVRGEKFDAVICPGDFTDMFSIPKEFSQMDIANLIIQKLLTIKAPLLCTPGNHDPYEIVELFDEYGINLHAKSKTVGGTQFVGWGGALTPFNTVFEPSDEETKETLAALAKKTKPRQFVLVTHDPPKNTNVDKASSGSHVGSPVVREFIEKNQPILAISAHIHESPGADSLGETSIFYPGAVFNGSYGIVNIEGNKARCETKKFEQ